MDAAPFVTICIVTGRRIPLLDACLASLQAQVDPPPFELLVCSDGDRRRRATRSTTASPTRRIRTVAPGPPGRGRNVLLDERGGATCSCSSTTT